MKTIFIYTIVLYQKTLSPDTGFLRVLYTQKAPVCSFYPSCSEYTKQAIGIYGVRKGFLMGVRRMRKCGKVVENPIDKVI